MGVENKMCPQMYYPYPIDIIINSFLFFPIVLVNIPTPGSVGAPEK